MTERRGVLVAGAINTDLVARVQRAPAAGETVTGSAFDIFGGGKGANQALSAARSGAATTMLGAVGDDDFGRQRLADLRADGIDVENVDVSTVAASGVALIVVEEHGENRIAYVPGATLTITPDHAVAAFRRSGAAIVSTTLELPNEALLALYDAARSDGAVLVLNATPEPASGRQLVPLADVLIVNETEARDLLGDGQWDRWDETCRKLQEMGPRHIVITLGGEGAVARFGDATLQASAPPVEVVDTTGAGDAFCGAFAAHLAEGGDEAGALSAGIAAGALAVGVAGAQRSMPRRDAVERLAATVAVKAI